VDWGANFKILMELNEVYTPFCAKDTEPDK